MAMSWHGKLASARCTMAAFPPAERDFAAAWRWKRLPARPRRAALPSAIDVSFSKPC